MIHRYKITLDRPVRSIRRPASSHGGGRSEEVFEWLSGVRQRMQRDEEMRQAVISMAANIQQAVDRIPAMIEDNLRAVTSLATELGLTIAREIVCKAANDGLLDPSEVVLRCLEQAVRGASEQRVRIVVSPDDLNLVVENLEAHEQLQDLRSRVDFVADPGLERGCVEVVSQSGQLSYDPLEVLERICDEIRGEGTAE